MCDIGLRGDNHICTDTNIRIHRSAEVEEQLHLYSIASRRHLLTIEVAGVARRRADGVVDVEYIRRAFAREAAQPTQCDLDVARAEFDGIVEIAEVALLPDLDGLFLRSEEHTSELQLLMRTSYAVFCLKKKIFYSSLVTSTM